MIMQQGTNEQQLLQLAIEAFYRQTGLRLRAQAGDLDIGGRGVDAIVEVEGYKILRFTAEVKKWAQQKNIGAMLEQVRQLPGKGMLVADYVNPNMADKMRELDIPFIDIAGNAYINEKPLFVFVKGNRQEKITGAAQRGRAFKPTGIKVIHALLLKPELVNATYREIKDAAGVAIGTIGWIFYDLKEAGFMVEAHKNKRYLQNKNKLLDRWVEAYLERLRPKQLVGRFTVEDENWWKYFDLRKYRAHWGGEVAAAKMTDYLRPEKLTIYLPKKGGEELFRDARFRKDEFGEIAVYRAFWGDGMEYLNYQNDLVDPLIVYADLLATANARNIETAKIIYGEEIARLIDGY